MSEMVERVARAICAADDGHHSGAPDDRDLWLPHQIKENPALRNWMVYKDQARAAIAAMRKPTEAMAEAFWRDADRVPETFFPAMIDEALK